MSPLKLILFFLFRIINKLAQKVWWKITGIEAQFQSSLTANLTDKRIQVRRIIFKLPIDEDEIKASDTGNFISWHDDFYPFDYLLKSNVSLYMILNKTEIYFIETNPNVNIYDTRKQPFLFNAQYDHAQRVIRVHSDDLVEYAKSLDQPRVNTVWITHSSRCGSTALAQALATLPNWTTCSECYWCATALPIDCDSFEKAKSFFTGQLFRDMVVACVKIQLLHFPDDGNLCWKTSFLYDSWILPIIREEFPEHRFLFMTRDGLDSVQSAYKMLGSHPIVNLIISFINYYPRLVPYWERAKRIPYHYSHGYMTERIHDYFYDGNLQTLEAFYAGWVISINLLRENCSNIPLMVIKYEDYTNDLEESVKKVLEYIGALSPQNIELALKSYELDSQANSPMSQELLQQRKTWVRDETSVRKMENLANAFNLPLIDEQINASYFNFPNWKLIMK